jgi:tetratricopeptide (TPR) repeat protein
MANMHRGILAWFDFSRGYGHITDSAGNRFIVHRKCMKKGYLPRMGDGVTFTARPVPAGVLAENVSFDASGEDELVVPLTAPLEVQTIDPSPAIGAAVEPLAPPTDAPVPQPSKPLVSHIDPTALPSSVVAKASSGDQVHTARVQHSEPARLSSTLSTGRDDLLAQALLFESRGDDKRARECFERGMRLKPPSAQLITAYVKFERHRSRTAAAREILRRGLELHAHGERIRSHLLATLGQLELRTRRYERAIDLLTESLRLADRAANKGEQWRYLALAYAGSHRSDKVLAAWTAVQEALASGAHFSQEESLALLPCLFGGEIPRLTKLLALLDILAFKIVAVGEQITNRFAHAPPALVTLLIRASTAIYQNTFDLADDLLVVCPLSTQVDFSVVKSAESLYQHHRRSANVHPSCFFLVLDDLPRLRQQLLRRAEQPGSAIIVPIEDRLLAGMPEDAHKDFQAVLQDWLFQIDRFRNNQPVSGRNFFGREQIFGAIEAQIDDARSVGIFGLRKIGKTSILKQLVDRRLGDAVAYVDLQALPPGAVSVDYVLWMAGDALLEDAQAKYGPSIANDLELFGRHHTFPGGSLGLAFDNDLGRLAFALQNMNVAAEPKLVLMLDEVEKFFPPPLGSRGISGFDEFFSYLRGKAQQHEWFVSMVAGANARIVEEPHWLGVDNPVFRFYDTIYIPPLEPGESTEMITALGRGMGLLFTADTCDAINRATGCHPFVVRQLCSLIFRTYSTRPLSVTADHVSGVSAIFALQEDSTFREMVDRLRRQFPDELAVLLHLTTVEGASIAKLRKLFPVRASEVLSHLVGYSLITLHGEIATIAFPLLREWLANNRTMLLESA